MDPQSSARRTTRSSCYPTTGGGLIALADSTGMIMAGPTHLPPSRDRKNRMTAHTLLLGAADVWDCPRTKQGIIV